MDYFQALIDNYKERYSKVYQDDDYYYLYKHFSFGPYGAESEFKVLDTFHNSSLLFSKPTTFNDPYDCYSVIDYDFSKITKAEFEDIFQIKITHKEFKLKKEVYIRKLKNKDFVKNWGDARRNGIRLTCFNGSPLNILMWAHYAFNHQGFMVEFKFKKIKNNFIHCPIPVFYDDTFPFIKYPHNASAKMCLENQNFGAETIIKLFANKAECWSYENEFRLQETGNQDTNKPDKSPVEIDSNLFVNVVLGIKTSDRHAVEIEKAVKSFNSKQNMDLQIFRAEMKTDRYEIFVPNHPRLDR